MSRLILFSVCTLLSVKLIQAQDFNVSMEEGHSLLQLTANDSLEGNAIIALDRDGKKGRAGILVNLNEASDTTSEGRSYQYDPRWFVGTKDSSSFGIFFETKKFEHIDFWRPLPVITIDPDFNSDGIRGDDSVIISDGDLTLRHTRLEDIYTTETKALRLHNGDFIPEDFITSFDLGNAEVNEHWDNVVAREFVDYTDLIATTSRSLKSNGYGLNQIMQLAPVKSTNLKSQESKIALDPYDVVKYIPEAVHTYDFDGEKNGKRIKKKVKNYGMKYNQLIPVLIQAIQEQQLMITDMQAQIYALKK